MYNWSAPFLYHEDESTNFGHKELYKWIVMILKKYEKG